ncbi:hypothetical protein POSPLADRAFT_1099666, partial [Postia placenta MAD-698-R-SB12]
MGRLGQAVHVGPCAAGLCAACRRGHGGRRYVDCAGGEGGAGNAAGIVGGGAVLVEVLEGATTPFDVPEPEASALLMMTGVNLDAVEDLPALPKLKEFSLKRLDPAAGVECEGLHSRAIVDLEEHRRSGGCCGISSMPLVDSIPYHETRDSAGAEASVWKDDLAFGVTLALAVPDVDLRKLAGAYPAATIAAVVARLFNSAVLVDVDGSLLSRCRGV